MVVALQALACELPVRSGVPLSRWSRADLRREVLAQGLVAEISGTTVWRWLQADAIRPWQTRSWIFPRDPEFAAKAGHILDLYERQWEGVPLDPTEYVLSADEKTSIQARVRCHPTRPPQPGVPMRVEHEYARGGALVYLAAWDVHQATLFGRCEPTTGKAPFDRLVAQVMAQSRTAPRRGSSGSSTTGPPTAGPPRSRGSSRPGRRSSRSTRPSTRVGSTRSRSTSPSCNGRC